MFLFWSLLGVGLLASLSWDGSDDDATEEDSAPPDADPTMTVITGTEGADAFPALPYGTDAAESFDLLGGDDVAFGNGGDDLMLLGLGDDFANAGLGDDTVRASGGADTVYGSAGDDILRGGGGGDILDGEAGDDELFGNSGQDNLFGSAGVDRLFGGDGEDTLAGGSGADYVAGEDGDDLVDGAFDVTGRTTGLDVSSVTIDQGGDLLLGGPGEDLMSFGPSDTVRGGIGEDFYFGYVTSPWSGPAVIEDMEAGSELVLDVTQVAAAPDASQIGLTGQGTDTMVSYAGTDIVLLRNIDATQFSIYLIAHGTGVTV